MDGDNHGDYITSISEEGEDLEDEDEYQMSGGGDGDFGEDNYNTAGQPYQEQQIDQDNLEVDQFSSRPTTANAGESIRVLVRVRPSTDMDGGDDYTSNSDSIQIVDQATLSASNRDGSKTFQCSFDSVLAPTSTQEEVYAQVAECTESVLDGFNSTIFAYGQTGSGKTHTMFGPPSDVDSKTRDESMIGVIPRAIEEIFRTAKSKAVLKCSIYCSFIQIYNENLFDMLRDANMSQALTIREDQKEIYVQGLSEYNVKSVSDTLHLLKIAEENRAIRETHMNQFSSRSHSIFQIYVEQKRVAEDGGEIYLRAKFNLVDLAGSEKWNIYQSMEDQHINEMTNINLSLHTLGRCISGLAQRANGKDTHIPYRESKLTRLLQDSIGGNARTCLIATISPSRMNAEESISTLKFADRAKQVMVIATVNETRPVDHALVQRLQKEIVHLKGLVAAMREHLPPDFLENHPRLASGGTDESDRASMIQDVANDDGELGGGNVDNIKYKNLESENEKLRRELSRYKSRKAEPSAPIAVKPEPKHNEQDKARLAAQNACLSQVEPVIKALLDQNKQLWASCSNLEGLINKFFSFVIEEDDLKADAAKIFHSLVPLRNEDPEPGAERLTASIRKLKEIEALAQGSSPARNVVSTDISGYGAGYFAADRSHVSPYKQQINPKPSKSPFKENSKNGSNTKKQLPALHTNGSIRSSQDFRSSGVDVSNFSAEKKKQQNMGSRAGSLPVMSLPSNHSSQYNGNRSTQNSMESLHIDTNSGHDNSGSGKMKSPKAPLSSKSNGRSRSDRTSNSAAAQATAQAAAQAAADLTAMSIMSPNGTKPRKKAFDAQKIYAAAAADLSGSSIQFRVRGSQEGDDWIAPVEEVDQEEVLRKELAKAQKKLRKQQQLQEWMREKEEKAMLQQKEAEDIRLAQHKEEQEREKKRKAREKKLKRKINGYHDQIKTEAEKIQELMDMGIDPASLF